MKISKFLTTKSRNSWRIFWVVFSTVALVSSIVIFVTFYGLSTGNFVIGISDNAESKNISISQEAMSQENKKSINFYENDMQSPGSFYLIKSRLDEIIGSDDPYEGDLKDNLVVTNFYIRNLNNNLTVNLKYSAISLDMNKRNLSLSPWTILMAYNDEYHIFRDPEFDKTRFPIDYHLHDLVDGPTPFEDYIMNLLPGTEKRISLVIWMNGGGDKRPEPFNFSLYFQAIDVKKGDAT